MNLPRTRDTLLWLCLLKLSCNFIGLSSSYNCANYCRLKAAGAVLIAKLVTGAMAWDDIWFGGQTKNPWNIREGSTGSSAGPAASTSAGTFIILHQFNDPNTSNITNGKRNSWELN